MNFLELSELVKVNINKLNKINKFLMTLSLSDKQDRWRCRQGIYIWNQFDSKFINSLVESMSRRILALLKARDYFYILYVRCECDLIKLF